MSNPAEFDIIAPEPNVQLLAGSKIRFAFARNFRRRWILKHSMAQVKLDSEIIRQCEPYTPLLTGMLIKTGTIGTVIGSGKISWIAPYARRQYYSPRKPGSATGALRGPFWFERAKAEWKSYWLMIAAVELGKAG